VNIGLALGATTVLALVALPNFATASWAGAFVFSVHYVERAAYGFGSPAMLKSLRGPLAVMLFIEIGMFPFAHRHVVLLG
jgi:hypothetical protein